MVYALIFDFDGVIIDTETPDFASWQDVYRSYGAELDPALWKSFIGAGQGLFDVYGHLEHLVGAQVDREHIRELRRRHYLDVVAAQPVLPGVLEYVSQARDLGLKVGLASSSSRDWVLGHLASRGLTRHFDVIRCADNVSRVKPDPELYLRAVADLGTVPAQALAIEDSPNGVTAAKGAGLYCVAVPNGMTGDLQLDHADLTLSSLVDLSLGELLARLDGH